jgi:hypothetical protein
MLLKHAAAMVSHAAGGSGGGDGAAAGRGLPLLAQQAEGSDVSSTEPLNERGEDAPDGLDVGDRYY